MFPAERFSILRDGFGWPHHFRRTLLYTPTAQNLGNAEDQLRATVKQGLGAGASDSTIEQRLAMSAGLRSLHQLFVHVVRVYQAASQGGRISNAPKVFNTKYTEILIFFVYFVFFVFKVKK